MRRITAITLGAALFIGSAALCFAGNTEVDASQIVKKGCACHNKKGDLNGKNVAHLKARMLQFKSGEGDPQLMRRVMKKYSAEQIDALADYYSKQ